MRKKISEPPVYKYRSNKYTLDPPTKWSVNAFKYNFLENVSVSFLGSIILDCGTQDTLKKISARKILYLYVAPRTFTGQCCNITYLYSVDPDPCVVGQEHEDFLKFLFLTKTCTKIMAVFVSVMTVMFQKIKSETLHSRNKLVHLRIRSMYPHNTTPLCYHWTTAASWTCRDFLNNKNKANSLFTVHANCEKYC